MGDAPLAPLIISDTTLRDGEQTPGALLDAADKVAIATALSAAGVKVIEAGFPAAGEREREAVRQVAEAVTDAMIVAFCRALPGDIDAAAEAFEGVSLKRCGVNLFLATSRLHLERKLHKTEAQLLEMITAAVSHAKTQFHTVTFGAEDASRSDPAFLCQAYRTALDAGATAIGFPDTVGILTPEQTRRWIGMIQQEVLARQPALLGVHFHNDLGLGTANTLAAVEEGVPIVQCTVGGLGERAGNAPLEEVVMALSLHPEQYGRQLSVDPKALVGLCRLVSERSGVPVAPNKAVAGANVFATTAGVHQDGILKDPETYLPFLPEAVGAMPVRLPLSPLSGKAALRKRLEELGVKVPEAELPLVLQAMKAAPKEAWRDEVSLLASCVKSTWQNENVVE